MRFNQSSGSVSVKQNMVWIPNTACFCNKCFNTSFETGGCHNDWKEFSMLNPTKTVKLKQDNKDNKNETRWNKEKVLEKELIETNVNNFVAAVYERKVIIRECWGQNSGGIRLIAGLESAVTAQICPCN